MATTPDWEMERTTIKVRVEFYDTSHVRFRIYAGPTGRTLALCGVVIMNPTEYASFVDALRAGAKQVPLDVEVDEEAFKRPKV